MDPLLAFEQLRWIGLAPVLLAVWVLLGGYGVRRARGDYEFLSHLKCPQCQTDVRPMNRKALHRLLGLCFLAGIDRYRCPQCQFQRTLWCE